MTHNVFVWPMDLLIFNWPTTNVIFKNSKLKKKLSAAFEYLIPNKIKPFYFKIDYNNFTTLNLAVAAYIGGEKLFFICKIFLFR